MELIRFTKMHGLGNDYVYIDCLGGEPSDLNGLSVEMSDRHKGVGSDGIVTIGKSDIADFKMRIFNADGSEAQMCGNGSRCVGKYLHDKGITDKTELTLETLAGVKRLRLNLDEAGRVDTVTVDMGEPQTQSSKVPVATNMKQYINQPLSTSCGDLRITAISMGNPHGVVFVNHMRQIDVGRLGRELEHHFIWPERANIEFVEVNGPDRIEMRVWERGSGETMACGTGACAAVVAGVLTGRTGRDVIVGLRGGDLKVKWDPSDNRVYMTGPAETVFEGVYERKEAR